MKLLVVGVEGEEGMKKVERGRKKKKEKDMNLAPSICNGSKCPAQIP